MSTAIRDSADIGSPCVPEATTTTLLGSACIMSCGRSKMPSGRLQQSERMRDFSDVIHAAAEERHFAAILGGHIQDLLQPVNGRTEAGDHQPPLGAIKDFVQARAHGAFAFGVARPVDVGGVGHQQQHAALAVFGEGVQIERLVVGGRGIHLEIAGVNDDAERRGDRQRHRTARWSA